MKINDRKTESVEVNINGVPLEGIKHIDFDPIKGCLVLVSKDGRTQDIRLKEGT